MSAPSPLWCSASASSYAQGHDEVPSLTTVSSEWRTSLDFAQQLDTVAEKELHALWSKLWAATHSEAALQTALGSRRTPWNPYRPARGGPEVKAEILNSEVVEFKTMVPTDSLYLHGVAVQPSASLPAGSASRPDSSFRVSSSVISPVSPHGTRGQRKVMTSNGDAEEEKLVMDGPSALTFRLQSMSTTLPTHDSPETALHDSSWWAVRPAESEAALFYYVWEAVVVPYYASMPTAFFDAVRYGESAATQPSDSWMSLVPRHEERDDREVSGIVTAFGTTREGDQKWSYETRLRSSSPSLASVSLMQKRDVSNAGEARASLMATRRAQRRGSGGVSHVMASCEVDIVSDDSLEAEVLEECKGSSSLSRRHSALLEGKGSDKNAGTPSPEGTLPEHNSRHSQRPSTACVHGFTTTPMEVEIIADMLPPGLTDASALRTQQRAATACSKSMSITGTLSAPRSGGAVASASMEDALPLRGKASGRKEEPLFHITAKLSENAPMTTLLSPPRAAAGQGLPRAQQEGTEGECAALAVVVVAAENKRRLQQRAPPPSEISKAQGGRTTAIATRRKASSVTRSTSRTASATRRSNGDRVTMPPTAGSNASAQRPLQLLDRHSRCTLRSPMQQRIPSPIFKATQESGRGKSVMTEMASPELWTPHPQRCGILSPMQLPSRNKQRRHAGRLKKEVVSERRSPEGFDLSEKMTSNSRPLLLHELTVHSASAKRQRPSVLNSRGVTNPTVSLAMRNSSIGARRPGEVPQRLTSKMKGVSTVAQRPTTLHR
ncbi:hypothetical protein Q4I28_008436 [Leishmania naiffi]|uniref:Uncharacterized protein n=1 Tax=Leishmania naiffi TaxID=5678 RepID=A0AAW3B3D6_9TRYP